MLHSLEEFKHIVDGKIQVIKTPHPLEGRQSKQVFIETFISCFEDDISYKDISGGNHKLYKIFYKGYSYNIFIEAFDGGGRDKTDGAKKISITGIKVFRELIDNGEPVLIINQYSFLTKLSNNNYQCTDNIVYGIIKPNQIYTSKVVKTRNPSSRWVHLEDMIKANKNMQILTNNRDNVYIVPAELIQQFFDIRILDEQYNEMTKFIYEHEKDAKSAEEKMTRLFREQLIRKHGLKCQLFNCNVNTSDLLVASHINARANIRNNKNLSQIEKLEQIRDVNNGFLLCRTHDSVFDKKYITFTDYGELVVSPIISSNLTEFNLENYEGMKIVQISENQLKYLKVHQEEFKEKINLEDFN